MALSDREYGEEVPGFPGLVHFPAAGGIGRLLLRIRHGGVAHLEPLGSGWQRTIQPIVGGMAGQ